MLLLLPGNPTGHWGNEVKGWPSHLCGWLIAPNRAMSTMRDILAEAPWAADNERFSQTRDFQPHLYIQFAQRLALYPGRCLFITVPDEIADAQATRRLWHQHAPQLRETGLPLAYVAQDGMTELPDVDFDCFFIGGSTQFKLSATARRLAHTAAQAGKWIHVGRVNSRSRLLYAWKIGAHSVDGTGWTKRTKKQLKDTLTLLRLIHAADLNT